MNEQLNSIFWPGKDYQGILSTYLSIGELNNRGNLTIFRGEDELGFFTGALVNNSLIKPLFIRVYDDTKDGWVNFHTDIEQDEEIAKEYIKYLFKLKKEDIQWIKNSAENKAIL